MRCRAERIAILVWTLACPATGAPTSEPAVRLLDVPFVPQETALCGGAALSMAMRYWGATGLHAPDFAHLLSKDGRSIAAADLEKASNTDSWRSLPVGTGMQSLADALARGHPIVVLVRETSNIGHYVVVVGLDRERVCIHDPRRGPFRILDRARFEASWRAAGAWGLIVLPRHAGTAERDRSTHVPPSSQPSACDSLVQAGIDAALADDLENAERKLGLARAACPFAAAPLRELAGVRFLQKRWFEAESLAAVSTRFEPLDTHAWQLIAVSRYVRGEFEGALEAWNAIDAPRIDLTRIDGLDRTRYDVVAGFLGVRDGALLTEATLRRARRRLGTLPSRTGGSLAYVPLPDGSARVEVHLIEKHRWSVDDRTSLAAATARALVDREIVFDLASPLERGELWRARWRFWENRPHVAAEVLLPIGAGISTVRGSWERQPLRLRGVATSERRWAEWTYGCWQTADVRWEAGTSWTRWANRRLDVGLRGAIELRGAGDHLQLRANFAHAWGARGFAAYGTHDLVAAWRSNPSPAPRRLQATARVGFATATAGSPPVLWPAAGSEAVASIALRAHPLYEHGVLAGKGWARELVHGGIEAQAWPFRVGLAQLGVATFVDIVQPRAHGHPAAGALHADVGAGLRVRIPSMSEALRFDVARGMQDGSFALSVGFTAKPTWMP